MQPIGVHAWLIFLPELFTPDFNPRFLIIHNIFDFRDSGIWSGARPRGGTYFLITYMVVPLGHFPNLGVSCCMCCGEYPCV